jgi:carboxypeptidase Taq
VLGTEQHNINFTQSDSRINELLKLIHEINDLESLRSLAHWDQQTVMPEGASEARSNQLATLQGLIHERWTASQLAKLLDELEPVVKHEPYTDADRGLLHEARRTYDRSSKLPRQLVEEIERTQIISHMAWERARVQNDFAGFAPHLQRTIGFQRELADRYGYQENRYDALLDSFEPGLTVKKVERLFAPIREVGISLLKRIQASKQVDTSIFERDFSQALQTQLAEKLLLNAGYDFTRGQLAVSTHPFTSGLSAPQDVRLTVRFNSLPGLIAVALHEGGHALYEQGVSANLLRTPLAGGASYGIHESQSRLWENIVGRSEPYWHGQYALIREFFPQEFKDVSVEDFVRAFNRVEASLIRVEADEVTYNLHILIRYELEQAMVNGEISVESLPRLWNEKYRAYLGVEPDSDVNGVLQDVHWTSDFGYFPSYTLGNLYSAQIYQTLRKTFPDFNQRLAGGDTSFLLTWLQEQIYQFGVIYQPEDLLQRVTGEEPNPQYLVQYLTEKFSKIYGL